MDKTDGLFQIAILLYPGVAALDAVGPWEVLSRMPDTEVRFVGKDDGSVMTEGGVLLLGVTHTVAEKPTASGTVIWKVSSFSPSRTSICSVSM
jgi:putative intracellular protease/amidase